MANSSGYLKDHQNYITWRQDFNSAMAKKGLASMFDGTFNYIDKPDEDKVRKELKALMHTRVPPTAVEALLAEREAHYECQEKFKEFAFDLLKERVTTAIKISLFDKPHQALQYIERHYRPDRERAFDHTVGELESLKQGQFTARANYFSAIRLKLQIIGVTGISFPERIVVSKILRGLGPEYDPFVEKLYSQGVPQTVEQLEQRLKTFDNARPRRA